MASLLRSLLAKLIGPKRRGAVAGSISPSTAHCPMTINQFTKLFIKSRICSESEARDAAESFAAECRSSKTTPRVESFCELLVATNRLTEWQCGKLRMGRWKRFQLDHYVMTEQVGKGFDSACYNARDLRNDEPVCLIVTPVNLTNGRIEYRAYPYL
jgi:hypothetical protein